ncbi:hypothetical protein LSH36_12g17008 [Paralvinella palmiformis]|uniref:Anaphase-promoting complex subunit 4-like WD40 domain-containing protein n=1 Tax=Paralvinella palmiformis TaxID=53620 RepID=A0AAD9KDF7_9ANNE|nr:hypothetical protein LSH36_12g17008 [Paralvinella palmiformis]
MQSQSQRRASQALSIASDILDASDHGDSKRDRPHLVEGNVKLTMILPREERQLESNDQHKTMCIRFSQDGSVIAVGQADGAIKLYNADTGQCLYVLTDDDITKFHLPVTSIHFKPYEDSDKVEHKSILIATYASGHIKFWHYTSSQCLQTINEERQTLSAAFNPSPSNMFATCGANPQLYLYDLKTKTKIRTLEASDTRNVMNGHKARVYVVQFHPRDQNIFLSGGWDDTVQCLTSALSVTLDRSKIAPLPCGQAVEPKAKCPLGRSLVFLIIYLEMKIYGPHICGDALDIDPIHNHIVTGSWRREDVLEIWHFESAEKIKTVPQDPSTNSMLYSAQWLGKENIMCGGCNPNMAKIIDRGTLNTVGQLVDLASGVYCMDHDHQIRPKIAAGASNKVYIMKMEKRQ